MPRSVRHSVWLASLLVMTGSALAEDAVFSGPQPGEELPALVVRGVFDDEAGKEHDVVAAAESQPLVVIFVHEITRPSLGVVRTVMDYAATRRHDKLHAAVVFLGDDATALENRLKQARHALPKETPIGISPAGKEGPGAYGLNRQVALTVLVAKEGKVAANFALVQPSIQADVPKILAALVQQVGGKAPTLEELGARQPAEDNMQDPKLRELLSPIIRKDATEENVSAAIRKLKEYLKVHPSTRVQVGDIARRIISAGLLENYGTPPAQEFLKQAAKEYNR